jgi:hypothetical protein
VVVDDLMGQAPEFRGFGAFVEVASNTPPIHDVRFDHVTAFPTRAILMLINRGGTKLTGFSITNSIFSAGQQQMVSAGGGPENCIGPKDKDPTGILNLCFENAVISHNLILDGRGSWPEHNTLVKDFDDAGLSKRDTPMGSEYRICTKKGDEASCKKTSPAVRAAKDGKNIGADVDAVDKATAGVVEGKRL